MTVWRDDESLAAFLTSQVHARAQKDGLNSLADGRILRVRILRVRITRAKAPLAWDDAVARLARDGRRCWG
jgi:heme-degrading monooxygenase HmoA